MARGDSETRNKRKVKFKEKKKHPYRKGGGKRSMNIKTK
jgi:hypothetical protein